nr:hypothetical protein [Candidatus Accumulibacter sp. ACC003]
MTRTDDQRGELTIGARAGDRDKAERHYGVLLQGVATFAEQGERLIAAFADRNAHPPAILELVEQRWRTVIAGAGDNNRVEGRSLGPTQGQRDEHHPHWRDRFSEPATLADDASAVQAMAHRLKTRISSVWPPDACETSELSAPIN